MDRPGPLRRAFWNEREHRFRAGWRLPLALVVLVVGTVVGTLVASLVAAAAPSTAPAAVTAVVTVLAQVLSYGALAAAVLVAAVLVDRRTLADLGLGRSRAWWSDLGFGLALGALLPALVFAIELSAGLARVTGTFAVRSGPTIPGIPVVPFALGFLLVALYFVAVGVFEELLVRGYLLTNIAEGLRGLGPISARGGLAVATVATSLLFGLGHFANPNASLVAVLTITLYGVFLAAGYLLTGRIAVPIGIHITWNLTVSSVFGFPVSGVRTPVTVIAVEQTGPTAVTGGAFGPEAGLVSLVVLPVGLAALAGWDRWRTGEARVEDGVATPDLRHGGGKTDEATVDTAPDRS